MLNCVHADVLVTLVACCEQHCCIWMAIKYEVATL
jgi:hypothetical protein